MIAFNNATMDGYFTTRNSDISWAHSAPTDAECNAFVRVVHTIRTTV